VISLQQELQKTLEQMNCTGHEILYFETIDSTNTWLKHAALEGAADGTVVIAEHQTAGRGRMTRSFESPTGKGLYLSVLLQPQNIPPERLVPITALAGVAVCNAVERICGIRPALKWPNDLVLGKRKLCGILTEMVFNENGAPCVILGIGINVSHSLEDFSSEVRELATSLQIELGREISKVQLAAALVREIDRVYLAMQTEVLEMYHMIYRRDCVNLGKRIQLIHTDGTRTAAEALDIDQDFGLIVRTEDGEQKTVHSGEVSVRGLYGYME